MAFSAYFNGLEEPRSGNYNRAHYPALNAGVDFGAWRGLMPVSCWEQAKPQTPNRKARKGPSSGLQGPV